MGAVIQRQGTYKIFKVMLNECYLGVSSIFA